MLKGNPVTLEISPTPYVRLGAPCFQIDPFVYMPGTTQQKPLFCCDECKQFLGVSTVWPLSFQPCTHRRLTDYFYDRNLIWFHTLSARFSYSPCYRISVPFGFLRFRDVDLPTELKMKVWWIIVMLFMKNIEFQKVIPLTPYYRYPEGRRERDEEANQRVYLFLKEKAFVSQ